METVNFSYRALRRAVGILGIALPLLLIAGNQFSVEGSISYFYYTKMSTVFTGILISFGLILCTYRGTDSSYRLGENFLTNLGGVFALIVALVPTKFGEEVSAIFYVHNDWIRGWVHNVSAVLFIFLMGLVVLLIFAKATYYRTYYKIFGILVMVGLAFAVFAFVYESTNERPLFKGAIFWGEAFSLWAFGFAWLRRGVPKKKH